MGEAFMNTAQDVSLSPMPQGSEARLKFFARQYRHRLKRPISEQAEALDSIELLMARIDGMAEDGLVDLMLPADRLAVDLCAKDTCQLEEAMYRLGYGKILSQWSRFEELVVHIPRIKH